MLSIETTNTTTEKREGSTITVSSIEKEDLSVIKRETVKVHQLMINKKYLFLPAVPSYILIHSSQD